MYDYVLFRDRECKKSKMDVACNKVPTDISGHLKHSFKFSREEWYHQNEYPQ